MTPTRSKQPSYLLWVFAMLSTKHLVTLIFLFVRLPWVSPRQELSIMYVVELKSQANAYVPFVCLLALITTELLAIKNR